jgi:hypothetical protein
MTGTDPAGQAGGARFDEPGYIAQRVCLWGNESFGLERPPTVGGVPLYITATTNASRLINISGVRPEKNKVS